MSGSILAIDQGTTSTRSIVFGADLAIRGSAQQEFPQKYPASGWVEHDPEDIWRTTVETVRGALADAGTDAAGVAALGITNQRETVLIWDRETSRPIANAIVWQDRRTADLCRKLRDDGAEALVTARSGLILDPYFSGTKIAWLLDNVEGARAAAQAGRLAFGTVDTFLLWRLTGGRVHATDATNASRTLLFDIHRNDWDEDLLRLLGVPRAILPEVRDSAGDFGTTEPALFGAAIPIRGVAGDQQAATVGQACFRPGMVKSTYGTGCFAVLNTGDEAVASKNRLLTTIAYRLDGRTTYALEGSIFIAGAAVQWLRDGLGLIERADESRFVRRGGGSGTGRHPGAGLHRSGRAALGPGGARCTSRADPRHRPARDRQGGAGIGGLPDPRPRRGDAPRLERRRGGDRAACRWRDGRQRLDHAAPRRHPRRAGRSPAYPRDHGAGCRVAGRARRRRLARHGGILAGVGARAALRIRHAARREATPCRRLARQRPPHALRRLSRPARVGEPAINYSSAIRRIHSDKLHKLLGNAAVVSRVDCARGGPMSSNAEKRNLRAPPRVPAPAVPADLRTRITKYNEHLLQLTSVLLGDQNEDSVRDCLDVVFRSYKAELLAAILEEKRGPGVRAQPQAEDAMAAQLRFYGLRPSREKPRRSLFGLSGTGEALPETS